MNNDDIIEFDGIEDWYEHADDVDELMDEASKDDESQR